MPLTLSEDFKLPDNYEETVEEVETKPEVAKVESEVSSEVETSEAPSELELEAAKTGWKPEGPKSAEEWVRNAPLYKTITESNKELKSLKETINAMKSHMDKQVEYGRQQALEELAAQRDEAIALGDIDQVYSIEDQMRDQEEVYADSDVQNIVDSTMTEDAKVALKDFEQRNSSWITEDSKETQAMKAIAAIKDKELVQYNLDPAIHLKLVEDEVKAKFPHKFQEETFSAASTLSGDTRGTTRRKTFTVADLDEEQKSCMRHFKENGILTEEEYINDLVKLGELK